MMLQYALLRRSTGVMVVFLISLGQGIISKSLTRTVTASSEYPGPLSLTSSVLCLIFLSAVLHSLVPLVAASTGEIPLSFAPTSHLLTHNLPVYLYVPKDNRHIRSKLNWKFFFLAVLGILRAIQYTGIINYAHINSSAREGCTCTGTTFQNKVRVTKRERERERERDRESK